MSSSAMELSILKLSSPRKKLGQSARFAFDNDLAQSFDKSNIISPKGKITGSSLNPWAESNRMIEDDDFFTIFEQHRAAIPFKWEETPGTRRDEAVTWVESQSSKNCMSDSEHEDSSTSSPAFSLSPTSSTSSSVTHREEPLVVGPIPEFQVKPIRLSSLTIPVKDNGSMLTLSDSSKLVDEPVCKGKALALKPPPGMHSVKQLLTLESEDRIINPLCLNSRSVNGLTSTSASNSRSIAFLRSHQRRSFRKDGLKGLPFLPTSKGHIEESSTPVLGFEEWSKVLELQKKEEKQQQQETSDIRPSHHRTMSLPRLSFSFRKKSFAEQENGNDLVDADAIFCGDFGKKDGLREHRSLSSTSSRTLADRSEVKPRNSVVGGDAEFSDTEYFDFPQVMIPEEDVKEKVQNNGNKDASNISDQVEAPKEKRKSESLLRLSRFFKSSSRISGGDDEKLHHRPARLSSISPSPLPPLALNENELSLKKASHPKQQASYTTASPLLKICLSNPIGQALLKNVKQLRAFDCRTPK